MPDAALASALVYRVRPASIGARHLEVTLRIERPAPDGQLLSLPAWIPGSYLIRDFARHVLHVEAESGGASLPVRKLDKGTWRVAPATGGELRIRAIVYAADPSVRGAWLDDRGSFYNGACLFFRVHGQESASCVVHVDPPEAPGDAGWRVATSLQRLTGAPGDFGAFRAEGYEDLIDHPVLMGRLAELGFAVGAVPHQMAIAGAEGADLARLSRDLAVLCAWHADFFRTPPPIDRYVFLVRASADGYGGLEHRFSSALACRRDDLPAPGASGPPADAYRRFLGLVSHEYFHLWLVKRIRPAEFLEADLGHEAYTRQLWIFEGITSYYDDLALVRSGLITPESYLELLGRSLTQFYRTAGRRQQTLEEASFDAWIKFYRPDENSPNATISYYLKGSLVALALDLEIRLRTRGAASLDDVLAALWKEHGEGSPGLAEGGFERLAEEVTGLDLDDFFRSNLRGTVDPPLAILLAQFGVRLGLRAAESGSDPGGQRGRREDRPRQWLGLKLQSAEGRLRVAVVHGGGPAEAAGICAGDELIALNGRRLAAEGYDAAVDRLQAGREATLHVFRDEELRVFSLEPVPAPRDTCYLQLDPEADPATIARRSAWLGGGAPVP